MVRRSESFVMKHFVNVCGRSEVKNYTSITVLVKVILLYAAHTTSKQLEAENRYLKQELEQRGRGKQQNQNQASSDSATLIVHKEELTSEPAAADPAKLPSRTRKEINILEDLDKENLFNPSLPCVNLKRKDHRVSLDKNIEQTTRRAGCEDQPVSL